MFEPSRLVPCTFTILNSAQRYRATERKQSSTRQSEAHKQITSHDPNGANISPELITSMQEQCEVSDRLKASKKECERLRENIVDLKAKLAKSEKNRDELQTQLVDLQKQLTETTDFVFSLNRREEKITASEVADEFNSLCGAVEDWVQTKLEDGIVARVAQRAIRANEGTKLLLSFIPKCGKEAFNYPETDECNLYAAVMRFLCNRIFDEAFYCPLGKGEIEFLKIIESSMRNLEPQRGSYISRLAQKTRLTFDSLIRSNNIANVAQ